MLHQDLTEQVLGAAIQVHKRLGPGLFESVYDTCFGVELEKRRVPFKRQVPLEVTYCGAQVDCAFRLDYVVDGKIVVELKAVDAILPLHIAQLLTYLRLGNFRVGLLINFNVARLKHGIVRRVYGGSPRVGGRLPADFAASSAALHKGGRRNDEGLVR